MKKRLEEHSKYGEHRMRLLFTYGVFREEHATLKTWAEGYVSGACGAGRSADSIESSFRRNPEIERFEKRWCVRMRLQVSSRGELGDLLVLDDVFTDQPRHLKADMISDVAVEAARDEERYILVDSRAPRKEIIECIDYLLPGGMKGKKVPFVVDIAHTEMDFALVASLPAEQSDCVAVAAALKPDLAKAAGFVEGVGLPPEKTAGPAYDRFNKLVRRIWDRWQGIRVVILPDEIAKAYPKETARFRPKKQP